jgi:hypothetical protein
MSLLTARICSGIEGFMTIADFTPITAVIGGLLIGASAVLLMATNGRIAGASGTVGRLMAFRPGDMAWRVAFVLGLMIGAAAFAAFSDSPVRIDASIPVLIVGGLLVGFGTGLGNGCTSGHGVCGTARLSARSITATLTFMVVGMATVYVARHVVGG